MDLKIPIYRKWKIAIGDLMQQKQGKKAGGR